MFRKQSVFRGISHDRGPRRRFMTEQITDRQKKTISGGSFASTANSTPARARRSREREQREIQSREGKLMAAIISADSRDDDVSVLNATAESPRRDYSRNVSAISQSRKDDAPPGEEALKKRRPNPIGARCAERNLCSSVVSREREREREDYLFPWRCQLSHSKSTAYRNITY